jgi:hypothetical protein
VPDPILKPQKGKMWKEEHAALREEFKVSSEFRPWTRDQSHRLHGVPQNFRMRELIDLAWIARLQHTAGKMTPEEARAGFFVDYGQSAARRPWGGNKTMTQGSSAIAMISCLHRFQLTAYL